jgi:endonuclease/exonuclease/phosphatase family metal-dependent hydrolase
VDVPDASRPAAPERSALAVESAPRVVCVHQRRADLGAPVHAQREGRGGFIRLAECSRVTVVESDARWTRVAFPLTEGRTEGWVSARYLVDCGICAPDAAGRDGGTDTERAWPPRPAGHCLDRGATGRERLGVDDDLDRATVGGGARGVPGARVGVVSFNVWELYDGSEGDRYLSSLHAGTPQEQYRSRRARLGRALRALDVDVLLLQEVENAAVVCEVAHEAWPRSGWACAATRRGGSSPMNLGVATRLGGTTRHLAPVAARETGPRGAIELSLDGAGGLTVTTVHLKSSRGHVAPQDCENARERMGAAAALASRYSTWSSVLLAGDFNVDPEDSGRAIYDRTDDVLVGRGFVRHCPRAGCASPTYGAGEARSEGASAIDLAFFRGGGVWAVDGVTVLALEGAGVAGPPLSDHRPLVVELRRTP